MTVKSEFQSVEHGKCKVTGNLTFYSVSSIWGQARKILPGIEDRRIDIDIGCARELDSGGLALLVAWSRWAYCNKKQISFSNASQKAYKLVAINKLQDLLKLT